MMAIVTARNRQSMHIARLLGAIGGALMGHGTGVGLDAVQNMGQAPARKARTTLTAAGPWILPALLG